MRTEILAKCMLAVTMASGAAGADYFPFTEGIVYEYEYTIREGTGTYITYFSGTADIAGATTHVLRFAGDGHEGLLNFWSGTPEGDKFHHGYQIDAYSLHFCPPILMIDEPLHVGKTWDVESRDSDSLAVRVHFEVTAFSEVTVPAGTFQAFTVEDTWEFPDGLPTGKMRALFWGIPGLPGTAQQVVRRIYADSIGQVVWEFGSRTDRLLSSRTVRVQPSSWTQIRMLYR